MQHMPTESCQWNARLSGCDTDLTLFQTFCTDKSQKKEEKKKVIKLQGYKGNTRAQRRSGIRFWGKRGETEGRSLQCCSSKLLFTPWPEGCRSFPGEDVFHTGDETCVTDLFFLHYSLADHPNLQMFCVAMLLFYLSIFSFVLPALSCITLGNQEFTI